MKKQFFKFAALALFFAGPVHAGPILLNEATVEFENSVSLGSLTATQSGTTGLSANDSLFAGTLGWSSSGIAVAGTGASVGTDWLSIFGYSANLGDASAMTSSSGFIDFTVGDSPILLSLVSHLFGNSLFSYTLTSSDWFSSNPPDSYLLGAGSAGRLDWSGSTFGNGAYLFGMNAVSVDEPGIFGLFAIGLFGLWYSRRQKISPDASPAVIAA